MASTFENNLRLEEIGTGEQSGTWGTKTNVNLELITDGLSYSSTGEAIANASTHTITMADGVADEFRSLYLKCTGGGQACTVTLAPNTLSKVWIIENTTSATLTFSQGSGANVAVLAGQVKVIATDGQGSGAAVFDLMQDLAVPDLFVDDDLTLQSDGAILNFGADSDINLIHTADTSLTLGGAGSTTGLLINNTATDGDPFLAFALSGTQVFTMGVDDGDGDKFKIGTTAIGTNTRLTIDSSGNATFSGSITSGSNIVSDTDSTDDLGTTSVRWANLFVDAITATDQVTATGFTGTLDGILGSGSPAAATVTTLDTSGVVNLNLVTDSTSSTSGALIVDGGVGIAKKLFVGTDLDVEGTTNLDVVDIDGAVQIDSTVTVGVDDTGYDVKFFGASASHFLLWDESADELVLAADSKLSFNDAAGGENIVASADGHLEVNAGTTLDVTAPTVQINASSVFDVNGNIDVSGTYTGGGLMTTGGNIVIPNAGNIGSASDTDAIAIAADGQVTFSQAISGTSADFDGGVTIDNITIDGTEIDLSSGSLTIDAHTDIILDADSGNWRFKDDGTSILEISRDSNTSVTLFSAVDDMDMLFKGKDSDGGGTITALTLDMSEAGDASFNRNVGIGHAPSGNLTAGYVLRLDGGSQTYLAFNNDTHTTQVTGGFVIGSDSSAARITQREDQPLLFDTGDTERMRLSSTGNLELIQSKNLYWKHQGGGTIRAGISADSSDNLTFSTGSSDTTRMTIDTNGNVGISSTGNAIDEILHIEKSTGTTLVKTEVGGNSTVGFEIKKTGATTSNWRIADGQTANGKLEIFDVTDSRSIMTFDGGGFVGVGTISPSSKIEVVGTGFTDSTIRLKRTDSGENNDAGLQFFANAGANSDHGMGGIWFFNSLDDNSYALIRARTDDSTGTSGRLDFITSTTAIGNTTAPSMTISSNGDVGIGTTSPVANTPLTLQGASGFTDTLQLKSVGTNIDSRINIAPTGTGNAQINNSAGTAIDFQISGADKMILDSSGRVGIGTPSPTGIHSLAKVLEISGGDGGDLIIGNNASTNIGAGAHVGAIAFKNIDSSTGSVPHYAGIRSESADTSGNMDLRFYTGTANLEADTPQVLINSSGNVLIGASASQSVFLSSGNALQIQGLGSNTSGISTTRHSADSGGPYFNFGKSRGTADGAVTAVQSGDILGQIFFSGADGTDIRSSGASIKAEVDGTSGSNDMPGRLVFSTTADNSDNPTERMRIDSSGNVKINDGDLIIGTAGHGIDFSAQTATDASDTSTSSELLDHYEEGTWTPNVGSASGSGGTSTSPSGRFTRIGNRVFADFFLTVNAIGSMSGAFFIVGFPFPANANNVLGQGAVRNQGIGGSNDIPVTFEMVAGGSYGRFHFASGTSTQRTVQVSDVSSGDFIAVSICYMV